jgi:hypothetical protein
MPHEMLTGWVYYNARLGDKYPYWIPGFVSGTSFYTISSVETEGRFLEYPSKTNKLHYPFKLDTFPHSEFTVSRKELE